MYTLDQVLRPEFPRSWHEAVALVQEVADSLGAITTVPAPEEIHVGEDGTIGLGFASEAAGDPVRGLGRLLLQLLEGVDAPAALQSLAVDNAKTPPAQSTVAGFTRALAFYERPDRRADLKAVAVRLSGQKAAVDAEYELQRLRERIASAEPEPATAPKEVRARPRMTSRQVGMAAIIVIALMGTFAGVRLVRGSSLKAVRSGDSPVVAVSPPPAPAAAEAEAEVSAPAAAPSASVGKASSAVAEASPPVAEVFQPAARIRPAAESNNRVVARALPVPSKQASQRSAALAGSRPPVAEAPVVRITADRWPPVTKTPSGSVGDPAATAGPSAPPPAPAVPSVRSPFSPLVSESGGSVWTNSTRGTKGTNGPRVATDAKAESLLALRDEPGRVYSAAEPEVTPARLLRSQLPQEPAADARTGYFELLVDESGDVEFVRLISPTHRYQDRILVAAAKAWKFKPAMLHGRPVKYRLSIPIILREPR